MLSSDFNTQTRSSGNKLIDIDYKLVLAIQNDGSLDALTQLINKYKKRVFNFCLRYTGNFDDADDITQDIFIKIYRKIDSFRHDSSFSTWLFRITSNTCKNHSRWRKSRKMDELLSIENNDINENSKSTSVTLKDTDLRPDEQLMHKELSELIDAAIQKLKPKQRSVIILKDYLGKSYNEISEIMNINLGTVKSTIARGRLNIAKQIEDYCKS